MARWTVFALAACFGLAAAHMTIGADTGARDATCPGNIGCTTSPAEGGNTIPCNAVGNVDTVARLTVDAGGIVTVNATVHIAHGGGYLAFYLGENADLATIPLTANVTTGDSPTSYIQVLDIPAIAGNNDWTIQVEFTTNSAGAGPYYQCIDINTVAATTTGAPSPAPGPSPAPAPGPSPAPATTAAPSPAPAPGPAPSPAGTTAVVPAITTAHAGTTAVRPTPPAPAPAPHPSPASTSTTTSDAVTTVASVALIAAAAVLLA